MDDSLAQKAISYALNGEWNLAVGVNLQILKTNPNDIFSLNRLTRAYMELGEIKNAKATAKKAIGLEPSNKIANKMLDKVKLLKEGEASLTKPMSAKTFIEEPGKTKIIPLIHLGDAKVVSKIDAGDVLKYQHHCHRISLFTQKDEYVGKLPDDISKKIKYMIDLGCDYQFIAKSYDTETFKILAREITKGKKASGLVSFPTEKIEYASFVSPNISVNTTSEL